MERHLRITGERKKIEKIIPIFLEKFKPITYVFSYEEKGDNHHVHAHLEYENVPKKQTLSDFMSKNGFKEKYYHQKLDKEPLNNLLYVLKDLDIITHNLEEERYKALIETTKRINEDKKKNARHKLYEIIRKKMQDYLDKKPNYEENKEAYEEWADNPPFTYLNDIADYIIDIYVIQYDKEPPLSHLKGYVLYIFKMLINDEKIKGLGIMRHMEIEYNQYLLKLF